MSFGAAYAAPVLFMLSMVRVEISSALYGKGVTKSFLFMPALLVRGAELPLMPPLMVRGDVMKPPPMPPLLERGDVMKPPPMPPLLERGGVTE